MKIAILLGPFQPMPPAGFGAVEKVWCELGRAFAEKGHTVTIVGRGSPGEQRAGEREGLRFVALRGFDATGNIAVDLMLDLLYAIRIVSRMPWADIAVTNSFWAPVILAPFQRRKGRIVVHAARFPKGQMRLYRNSAAIQAISPAVADAIRAQTPAIAGKVRVLGYPVDLSIFTPGDPVQAGAIRHSVLYVGRVHPEKGIHLLVEAFRRVVEKVPDATLEIVGPSEESRGGGGEAYLRKLESLSRGLKVKFTGPLADERAVASAYRRASCFCYPSIAERGEALGLAVLEAMACGTPCVISALECFGDFARHGENAIVFDHRLPDAAGRLSNALCSVLLDPNLASTLGARARTDAARFSVDRISDQYLRLFESVITGSATP